jgi:hypothetical protein
MVPTTKNIAEIATAYVGYLSSESEELQWASFAVIDMWLENRWDDTWELIKLVASFPKPLDGVPLATFAAGPVEDLLNKAGPAYIDRIEDFASENETMARMLSGVWPSSIEPAVWERVVTFCRKTSNPIDGDYRY